MSDLPVLKGVLVLLACQLLGEVVARLFALEVPGPVVGMLVFLVVLRVARPRPSSSLVRGPALLLEHLQLLFVPAGVGVVVYLDRLRADALPLAAGLWVSWLLGLAVTGAVVATLVRLASRGPR
ncbi:MAG: CidA/LrgA family protein [Nocardioidaceae bacterium]